MPYETKYTRAYPAMHESNANSTAKMRTPCIRFARVCCPTVDHTQRTLKILSSRDWRFHTKAANSIPSYYYAVQFPRTSVCASTSKAVRSAMGQRWFLCDSRNIVISVKLLFLTELCLISPSCPIPLCAFSAFEQALWCVEELDRLFADPCDASSCRGCVSFLSNCSIV